MWQSASEYNDKMLQLQISALSKSDLVLHYECRYLAPVEEFVTEKESVYTCPKCKKVLQRVGIDYGRPGLGFKCMNCDEVTQYPLVLIFCEKDHFSKINEMELVNYPVYRIAEESEEARARTIILSTIQETLKEKKVNSQIHVKIKGESGGTHTIPLLINTTPRIIVDFITQSNLQMRLLQVVTECVDLNATAILITKESLMPSVNQIVNPERIRIISVSDESEIPAKVTDMVLSIVSH